MALVFRFNTDPQTLGKSAESAGERTAVRANTLETLQAKQRRDMQAAENLMQLAQMQTQVQQRGLDRFHDLNRMLYSDAADLKRQTLVGNQQRQEFKDRLDAQVATDQRQFEMQTARDVQQAEHHDFASNREFNERRLLTREQFVNEGIKSGEFKFTPRQKQERQRKYDELAAVRSSRILRPHERAQVEAQIISELEAIEPLPVPFDERPRPNHESITAATVWFDGQQWQPLGNRKLSPGDRYRIPDGKGGFEDKVYKEKEYAADIEVEKERRKKEIARSMPPSDTDFIEAFNATRLSMVQERKQASLESGTGEEPLPPTDQEVTQRMELLKQARDKMYSGSQQQDQAVPRSPFPSSAGMTPDSPVLLDPNDDAGFEALPPGTFVRDASTGKVMRKPQPNYLNDGGQQIPVNTTTVNGMQRPTVYKDGRLHLAVNVGGQWKLGRPVDPDAPQTDASNQRFAEYQGRRYPLVTAKDGRRGIVVNGVFMVEDGADTANGQAVEGASLPRPQTEAERDALPPGAKYVAPDGSVRINSRSPSAG
jgi:hypothetical protein